MSAEHPSFLRDPPGIRSWLFTIDHKRVGVMFLIYTGVMLFVGGVFALLIRWEHLTPDPTIMTAMTYNRMFTFHGVVMIFLFMIPAIPAGFGNIVIPLMIGAKDVAFPRLNLASFWIFVFGSFIAIGGMIAGGSDTGWTFYVPYATQSPTAVVPIVIGAFILGMSSIVTGLNFIVTVHTVRTKGMRFHDMPLFVWAIYATSIIQVTATPVLGLSLLLVGIDHWFHWGIFDPANGGDPLLFQHLFWFYSHPAVYIMVLPALGVISEVVCTFSRKNPFSYRAIAYSSIGIALVGFFVWGHHMFTSGMSTFDAGAFGILSMVVGIFSAIKVFTWTATFYRGSISPKTPLFYLFAFLFLFVFGGMTGIAVATMSLDVHWHDTYFVVAHFHFIMVGGTLTAYLAALHYWFPKLTGRMYDEKWGLLTASLVFAGFFLTFFPQFLLGNGGMPRRYFSYPPQFQTLHIVSTAGSWILALGLTIVVVYLLVAIWRGKPAGNNPWGSMSIEWRSPSPPPRHNFVGPLELQHGTYDYWSEEGRRSVGASTMSELEPHEAVIPDRRPG